MKSLYELLPMESIQKEKYLVLSLILIFAGLFITPFLLFGFQDGFQIIIIGASTGSLYSILAIGFSLIFGVAKQLKLSLGGYYVVAAYTMFFLLEAGNVVPAFRVFEGGETVEIALDLTFFDFTFLDITFFTFNFNFDGILLLVVIFLPIIVSIALMLYLAKKMSKLQFAILLLSSVVAGTISVFPAVSTVQGFYALAVIPIISFALYYLEVSNKKITIIGIGTSFVTWLFLILNLFLSLSIPIIYIIFLILAVLFTAFVAILSDIYLLKKFRHSPVNVLIVTFALALVLQSLVQLIPFPRDFGRDFIPFGVEYRSLQAIVRTTESIDLFFGISIGLIDLITLGASIMVMLMLYLFIWHTKTGMALPAVSQDEEAALLTGIDIRKVTAIVSGIGMGLVGFASVLTSPYRAVPSWSPIMGWSVLILAIAIVTLGGMGSLPGTIIAAFLFAYIEIIISPIIASFSVILPFIAVILVMIFRPQGILGEKEVLE